MGELKQRLTDVWHGLQQNVIDSTVNEWGQRATENVCACTGTTFWTLITMSMTDTNLDRKNLNVNEMLFNFVYSPKKMLLAAKFVTFMIFKVDHGHAVTYMQTG